MASKPKLSVVSNVNPFDPDNHQLRLYKQITVLLEQLESTGSKERITMRERIAALIAVGRIEQFLVALRKRDGHDGAGATARKYETAFADAASRGAPRPGPGQSEPEPDDWFESAGAADDDDDGAA